MADRRTASLRLVNILDGCHSRLCPLPIVSCAVGNKVSSAKDIPKGRGVV